MTAGCIASSQFTSQRRSPRLELRFEQRELYSFADKTTLGFAISLMTSASVALADCFLVFFLPIGPMISLVRARLQVNLDRSYLLY